MPQECLSGENHLLGTVQTGNVDNLGCPDRIAAAGAEVFAGAGCARRRRSEVAAVSACAGDLETSELVAVDQDVGETVLQNEVQQSFAG